ncbi:MAG: RNA 2',3'-cyclic phosphodiesterase [Desulfovibrionaceae bacterium]
MPATSQPGAVRCFAALPLPGPCREALGVLLAGLRKVLDAERHGPGAAFRPGFVRPENAHLTLRFLGDVDAARVPGVLRALAGVRFAPFALRLGGLGGFPSLARPGVLLLELAQGATECAGLARLVEEALAPLGFEQETRPFRAHVTLARLRGAGRGRGPAVPAGAVGRAAELVATLVAARPLPAFRAERFTLYRSTLGPGGPVYTPLGEFSARG